MRTAQRRAQGNGEVRAAFLRWLYPGLGVKRWLFAFALSVLCLAGGLGLLLDPAAAGPFPGGGSGGVAAAGGMPPRTLGALLAAVGVGLAVFAMTRLITSLVGAVAPDAGTRMGEAIYLRRHLGRGPRVVALGGGTGLSVLLRGLKEYTSNLTAIVTVTDDGGSSGRLRGELGVPPPGDIRNCLVALADAEPLMAELFQHRFDRGSLAGHTVGNVFLSALTQVTGDFDAAVRAASRVLAVRGRVLPSTLASVTLCAALEDGRTVRGETSIVDSRGRIGRIWLEPNGARALPEALEAVGAAEMIVIGPGSLYTSLLPNLLLPDLCAAIRASRAFKVFVVNVMTQPGETDGMSAADHLEAVAAHAGDRLVDAVVVHVGAIEADRLAAYRLQGAERVPVERSRLEAAGVTVVARDLVAQGDLVRHDPDRLASTLVAELLERMGAPEPQRLVDHFLLQDRVRRAER